MTFLWYIIDHWQQNHTFQSRGVGVGVCEKEKIHHSRLWPCSDIHQALPYGQDFVRTTHQAWSKISTQNVRTTSGRGLKLSFGLLWAVWYNWGSIRGRWIGGVRSCLLRIRVLGCSCSRRDFCSIRPYSECQLKLSISKMKEREIRHSILLCPLFM